jgi:F-type H+-transporting ATPase subunit b
VQLNIGEILYIFFLVVLLYFILKRQFFDPLGTIIQTREDFFEDTNMYIAKASGEIAEKSKLKNESIEKSAATAYEIREAARKDAFRERKETISYSQQTASDILSKAREEINKATEDARISLNKDIDIFAKQITETILEREI